MEGVVDNPPIDTPVDKEDVEVWEDKEESNEEAIDKKSGALVDIISAVTTNAWEEALFRNFEEHIEWGRESYNALNKGSNWEDYNKKEAV